MEEAADLVAFGVFATVFPDWLPPLEVLVAGELDAWTTAGERREEWVAECVTTWWEAGGLVFVNLPANEPPLPLAVEEREDEVEDAEADFERLEDGCEGRELALREEETDFPDADVAAAAEILWSESFMYPSADWKQWSTKSIRSKWEMLLSSSGWASLAWAPEVWARDRARAAPRAAQGLGRRCSDCTGPPRPEKKERAEEGEWEVASIKVHGTFESNNIAKSSPPTTSWTRRQQQEEEEEVVASASASASASVSSSAAAADEEEEEEKGKKRAEEEDEVDEDGDDEEHEGEEKKR